MPLKCMCNYIIYNHFKHTSILPSSWDANRPVCYVYLLSFMLGCFLVWFVVSHGDGFFSRHCFPLGVLGSPHCRSVTTDEQFLFACAEHQEGHPPGTVLCVCFWVVGSCMMKVGLGLSCFSPTRAPFGFPDLRRVLFHTPFHQGGSFPRMSSYPGVLAPVPCPTPAQGHVSWPNTGVKLHPSSQHL